MEATKFRLLFKGDIASGSDIDEVKRKLSLLFKSDVAKIETLFSGKTKVLKDNLSENEALKLKKAFDGTGGVAIIERVSGQGAAGDDLNRPVGSGNEAPAAENPPPASGSTEKAEPGPADGADIRQASAEERRIIEDVHAMAAAQQLLIWGVVAGFAIFVSPVLYFVAVPFQLHAVYRISRVLKFGMARLVVCGFFVFLPPLSFIVLLVLNSKAAGALASAGVKGGLFGASQAELDVLAPGGKGSPLFVPVFATLLLAFAVAGISSGLLPTLTGGTSRHLGSSVERKIAAAKRKLPMRIDAETRLDGIVNGPNKQITYDCTLVNHPAGDLDAEKIRGAITGDIRRQTCGNDETRRYIEDGYSIAFSFRGNDGNPIAAVTVTSQDCGN